MAIDQLKEIILRRAEAEDVDSIAMMEASCFSDPWSWETIYDDVVLNDISHYIIALEDGILLGYIGTWAIAGECQINNVAVNPFRRGEGIGKLLLSAVLNAGELFGITYWTLEVRESNIPAINLYKGAGFNVVGRREKYYDDGEAALLMSKGEVRP